MNTQSHEGNSSRASMRITSRVPSSGASRPSMSSLKSRPNNDFAPLHSSSVSFVNCFASSAARYAGTRSASWNASERSMYRGSRLRSSSCRQKCIAATLSFSLSLLMITVLPTPAPALRIFTRHDRSSALRCAIRRTPQTPTAACPQRKNLRFFTNVRQKVDRPEKPLQPGQGIPQGWVASICFWFARCLPPRLVSWSGQKLFEEKKLI